jgi:tetratricopeptide (TPR) repeat protein
VQCLPPALPPMRHTILIATTTLLAAGAVVLFGGVLRESPSAGASALPAERVAAAFDPMFASARNADALVLRLQQQIRQSPDDAASHGLLGLAYEQRARETGDTSYYPRAETVLRRALELDEENAVAVSGLASLALSRHRFGEALVLARRARALAPTEARTLGAIGDALVELGRYREAFHVFDRLAQLKPGLAAYARVSYARELLGDRSGAIAAMRLAAETAVPGSEAAAWTALQLGKLFALGGDHASAERQFRTALGHVPGYAAAFDGLALVEAARGRLSRAISFERRAVATVPLPQYVATLGDLEQRAGRPRAAARQYSVVEAIDRAQRESGVTTDLELALFRIDHDRGLKAATSQAPAAYRLRPSIDAADVVAWGLARSGRCLEAKSYSKLALRLGTEDSLKFFHRGMIERCLGNDVAGKRWLQRALGLNPGFSPMWSPVAARYAR